MNTLESLQKASDDELRVMCAKLDGYTDEGEDHADDVFRFWRPGGYNTNSISDLPNYPGSLDAMAEAEATLHGEDQQEAFVTNLRRLILPLRLTFHIAHANARQRCIALILTKQA